MRRERPGLTSRHERQWNVEHAAGNNFILSLFKRAASNFHACKVAFKSVRLAPGKPKRKRRCPAQFSKHQITPTRTRSRRSKVSHFRDIFSSHKLPDPHTVIANIRFGAQCR